MGQSDDAQRRRERELESWKLSVMITVMILMTVLYDSYDDYDSATN